MRPMLNMMARNPFISLGFVGCHFLNRDLLLLVSLPAASSSVIFCAAYLHTQLYSSCIILVVVGNEVLVCEFMPVL
jgi:hypothetical protein